jgi:hypothetical protein
LLLIGMPIGYLSGGASTGDVIGLIVLTIVSLALIAWLVPQFVPRERARMPGRAGRTALIFGVLAFLGIAVFWTGLPFPFGATALALGLSTREAGPGGARGQATAGVILGGVGVLASFVLLLVG